MSEFRRRIPFQYSTDNDQEQSRILDEEEQEELVNALRAETSDAHNRYLWGIRIVVGLSCVLHLISLSDTRFPPTVALFPPSTYDIPPIPVPTLFTLLHVLVHLYLAVKSFPNQLPSIQTLNASRRFDLCCSAVSGLAPTLSILLMRGWANFVWWSFTAVAMGLDFLVRKWMYQDGEDLKELERLKYNAKGA